MSNLSPGKGIYLRPLKVSDVRRRTDWRVERLCALLDDVGCARENPISLTDAAKSLNLSNSRLRHLFKEKMGVSPKRLAKTLKIRQATDLLESTNLTVKEVMAKVGLNDLSHFVRDFKGALGLTPAAYRTYMLARGEQGKFQTYPASQNRQRIANLANK